MSIIAWIVLGLVAGFIASKVVNKSGEGVLLDIGLGVAGAVVGGWLFNAFGMVGVSGLNLYSLLVAVLGAVVVLVVYHALVRQGLSSDVSARDIDARRSAESRSHYSRSVGYGVCLGRENNRTIVAFASVFVEIS